MGMTDKTVDWFAESNRYAVALMEQGLKAEQEKYKHREQKIVANGAMLADHLIANGVTIQKHGRWVRHGCYGTNTGKRLWEYTCSECETLGSPQWKCCPVCTARMDGDGNG